MTTATYVGELDGSQLVSELFGMAWHGWAYNALECASLRYWAEVNATGAPSCDLYRGMVELGRLCDSHDAANGHA